MTVIEVYRPGDGASLGSVPTATPADVAEAVRTVRRVQPGWGSLEPADRARRLADLQEALRSRSEEAADVIVSETGKPRVEALAEVLVCLETIRHYRKVAPRVLRPRRPSTGWMLWKSARVLREPHGVVGVISPWNYPLILAMDPTVTALFAGNGVVLKPSEYTPYTGLFLEDLCRGAGLPEGLVSVVTGDGSAGAALVGAAVDKIHFTGSTATGRRVMAGAAESLTPVTLELGGKDPAIVLEDADLERAARGIVFGAFYNAGQTCVSTERVFVVETVYEPFLRRAVELVRELRVGVAGERDVGPMCHPGQLAIVEDHLRDALDRGARVLAGGGRDREGGRVVLPTILVDVERGMKILEEETFGPILPVVKVRDEREAIDRANEGSFGLFASVWTRRRARGVRVARSLRAGGVSINDTLSHYALPSLPMGGVGQSGFGRTRGEAGLLEMTRTRSIFEDRMGLRREPWWYPYSGVSLRLHRTLVEWRGGRGWDGVVRTLRALLGRTEDHR